MWFTIFQIWKKKRIKIKHKTLQKCVLNSGYWSLIPHEKHFLTAIIPPPHPQPIHGEVADHRPVILEVVHSAEQFLRDHRDRLHPNLQNKLKGLTSNLRSSYEQASLKSNDWLKEATQVLDLLKNEESDQVNSLSLFFLCLLRGIVLPFKLSSN